MANKPAAISISDSQLAAAMARGADLERTEPRAVRASYDHAAHKIVIALSNGVVMLIPPALLQGLQDAGPNQLGRMEIVGAGTGLHWPVLNVDHLISGLILGIFGSRRWMAEIGRKGGQARRSAKIAAAKRNGRRGGRPSYRIASAR